MGTEAIKRICVVGIPYYYDPKFIIRTMNHITSKMDMPEIATRGDGVVKEQGRFIGVDWYVMQWALRRGVGSKLLKYYDEGEGARNRDKTMVADCSHLVVFTDGKDADLRRILKYGELFGLKHKTIKV